MKKVSVLPVKAAIVFFVVLISFGACKGGETPAPGALDKDTSYAFGMFMADIAGTQLQFSGLHFDYNAFMEGFRDFNEARETRLTQEQVSEKISAVFMQIQTQLQTQNSEQMRIEGEKSLEEGKAFLEQNGARSGVTTTASGLQYEVITQGNGAKPGPNDTVRAHYEGTFIDGTVFDSSYERGEPAEFPLNRVIRGWSEGLQLMNEGSTYRFVIPGDLAYGVNPPPGSPFPPNATLIFKVEFISIVQ